MKDWPIVTYTVPLLTPNPSSPTKCTMYTPVLRRVTLLTNPCEFFCHARMGVECWSNG